jgi:hypothetical protein
MIKPICKKVLAVKVEIKSNFSLLPLLFSMFSLTAVGAVLMSPAWAQSGKKQMSCKLQSDKVKGKERTCIYVCEDKSLEGRTRKPESSCPSSINSTRS